MKRMHVVLILIIFMSSFFLAACSVKEGEHNGHKYQQDAKSQDMGLSGKVEHGVRIIDVKASRYKFEPDPIIVKLGEKIRLLAASTDVAHGLTIPDFNVNLAVDVKKSGSVEFIANKKGTFHAHCSVYCGPGHGHMHAAFIVK